MLPERPGVQGGWKGGGQVIVNQGLKDEEHLSWVTGSPHGGHGQCKACGGKKLA